MDERTVKEFETLKAAEKKYGLRYRQVVGLIQGTCSHSNIAESKYRSSDQSGPPYRICLNCGLTEEGWGCGYHFLKDDLMSNPAVTITREELYAQRHGVIVRQDMDDNRNLIRMILKWIETGNNY